VQDFNHAACPLACTVTEQQVARSSSLDCDMHINDRIALTASLIAGFFVSVLLILE
jgi:hypothetical protein